MLRPSMLQKLHKAVDEIAVLSGKIHSSVRSLELTIFEEEQSALYKPEFFELEEFVSAPVFDRFGQSAWWFIDVRIVWTADAIRHYFDRAVKINSWKWGGPFQFRGFRPYQSADWKPWSQHSFGRAIDFDVQGMDAQAVRSEVLAHQKDPHFRFITAIEDDVSWVHVDCRDTGKSEIMVFKP